MPKIASAKIRAPKILEILKKTYPNARCGLDFKSPLELLVATILSAQCTDARVNKITPALFKKYKSAEDFAKAPIAALEKMIKTTGFFRNKARSIKNCCAELISKYDGGVPKEIVELTTLAGVGRKTANVIRAYAFGLPGVICDTHVLRLTKRLGLTKNENPEKVEFDIMKLLPEKDWTSFSTTVVAHGRRCCAARKPLCDECPVYELCETKGKDTA